MKKDILVFGILSLLLVASCQQAQTAEEPEGMQMPVPGEDVDEAIVNGDMAGTEEAADTGSVKTFVLTGQNFRFSMGGQDNPDLKVKMGDRVRIEFTSQEGFHDWVVSEFNAATQRVNAGQSTSVEFTADKKGTFEYYCSVGSHKQAGMKGQLIVE